MKKSRKTPSFDVLALYRYFAYSAHMRKLCQQSTTPAAMESFFTDVSTFVLFFYTAPGLYLMHSYSGLYLVIEGWRCLNFKDAKIDSLLGSPYVDRLKRFRNATYHFQKTPISRKQLEFFGTAEERTEEWVNELYDEFARFFRDNTLPLPSQLRKSLKDKSSLEAIKIMKSYWNTVRDSDEITLLTQE